MSRPSQNETVAPVQIGQREGGGKAARVTEDHVALSGSLLPGLVGPNSTDDHIAVPVVVHVTGRSHGETAQVGRIDSLKTEAAGAVELRDLDESVKRAVCGIEGQDIFTPAEYHIAVAGAAVIVYLVTRSYADVAQYQINVPVTVHIPGQGGGFESGVSLYAKAVAAVKGAQVQPGGKAPVLAEHDIGIAVGDDYVIKAVAVDVAGRADGVLAAVQGEAVLAVELREIHINRSGGRLLDLDVRQESRGVEDDGSPEQLHPVAVDRCGNGAGHLFDGQSVFTGSGQNERLIRAVGHDDRDRVGTGGHHRQCSAGHTPADRFAVRAVVDDQRFHAEAQIVQEVAVRCVSRMQRVRRIALDDQGEPIDAGVSRKTGGVPDPLHDEAVIAAVPFDQDRGAPETAVHGQQVIVRAKQKIGLLDVFEGGPGYQIRNGEQTGCRSTGEGADQGGGPVPAVEEEVVAVRLTAVYVHRCLRGEKRNPVDPGAQVEGQL